MQPVTLLIIGCGARGGGYAEFARHFPERAKIVAVADPNPVRRNSVGDEHQVPAERRFTCWEDAAKAPRLADAVLICTQDVMHEAPAIAFASLGYAILLEKPMAPTAQACRNIVAAVKKAGVLFAVCHVLRYTAFTRKLKEILDSGAIGDIVSIQHLEPVGYWHQAHSFVRGNWRNAEESSPMLLAKCCHDLDWLRFIMGCPCRQVHSFGTLLHFRKEQAPHGAATRCVDCSKDIEGNCPYSALKIYLRDRLDKGCGGWPVSVLADKVTPDTVRKALEVGPYGRCVYACDNDVVDNQVVNLLFDNGATASMTMTAFMQHSGRLTRIFGTRGAVETDSNVIKVQDFLTDQERLVETAVQNDGGILTGHGGGDFGLMEAFVAAVSTRDPTQIHSGIDETLESHLMVFAAEESRHAGQTIAL